MSGITECRIRKNNDVSSLSLDPSSRVWKQLGGLFISDQVLKTSVRPVGRFAPSTDSSCDVLTATNVGDDVAVGHPALGSLLQHGGSDDERKHVLVV